MPLPKRNRVASYLLISLGTTLSWFLFWVLNRTVVIGMENLKKVGFKNLFMVSNHRSLFDSFGVGTAFCFPRILFDFSLSRAPFHTPDLEGYLRQKLLKGKFPFLAKVLMPIVSFLFINLKCLPVGENRKDLGALLRIKQVLPEGIVYTFPEGTRSRTGELGEGRTGVGKIIYDCQPLILPIFVEGIEDVMPRGAILPRIGRYIIITFGEPFDCQEFIGAPDNRETWEVITEKVMSKIGALAA
ncbi:MAG: hypothetical protein COY66_03505 [Candidatus Kerfeldbacteria bacterium CG_4_10_14_0_8_um_filter_42_10]|uniref:Phospholipid/glycerol acyltransferase domain-containing protein n=1 Tax=Candidatus Kerfeldbacteria bacterium CG_4_10_14_0_8_um_filter_42_10 TaxID=2014248 RepID=A0A2M7RIZ6_9BACT|nr:MAG: hypothetical protein COY66_03505 [Candidatus Kerfeldbacteria bacterium CG_4_10_14_0_8_um_filter_42_10]